MFQSTPSHGGRPFAVLVESFGVFVSIHALTRRATGERRPNSGVRTCFNPRPHTEGDVTDCTGRRKEFCFNPRPHTEGDQIRRPKDKVRTMAPLMFQSTPSHGGRHSVDRIPPPCCESFNPRPHTEGDLRRKIHLYHGLRFQSTPSHGGRLEPEDEFDSAWVSIHALTRRATGVKSSRRIHSFCFNPRPHTEGDCDHSNPLNCNHQEAGFREHFQIRSGTPNSWTDLFCQRSLFQ